MNIKTDFETYAIVGGRDNEGDDFFTLFIANSFEQARMYALDVINEGYDYAQLAGIKSNGEVDHNSALRIADCHNGPLEDS
jgi:hypothetical protein